MTTLDPKIESFLLDHYPDLSPLTLESMWFYAVCWVEGLVRESHTKPVLHPALEVAALFRVRAICANKDQELKAAYMFCAVESLSPYMK
jgi:hypothetical protein